MGMGEGERRARRGEREERLRRARRSGSVRGREYEGGNERDVVRDFSAERLLRVDEVSSFEKATRG